MPIIDLNKRSSGTTTFGDLNAGVTYSSPLLFGSYTQNNFLSIPAVYAALDIISSSIALMPINLRQKEENKDTIVENSPITALFDNMLQSKYTLFRTIVFDTIWWGNSFIYIKRDGKGNPIKLTYLQHGDVAIEYDKFNDTVSYNVVNHRNIPKKVKQYDMLHFIKNSKDGITGIGLLAYASGAMKLTDNMNNAASDFFGSGCGINGILKFQGMVPDKSKKDIREQWSAIHGAGSVGGGLAVVGGDCDFIPVNADPTKSQMLESRQFSIAEIARYFGISPLLLQDLSHGNTTAIEAVSIQFVKYTLMPLVSLIENELNRKLLTGITNMWLDLDESVLLSSDKQAMANYLSTLTKNGIITTNEARKQLDLNPMEGGDELIIPYTDLGMNTIGSKEGNETGN